MIALTKFTYKNEGTEQTKELEHATSRSLDNLYFIISHHSKTVITMETFTSGSGELKALQDRLKLAQKYEKTAKAMFVEAYNAVRAVCNCTEPRREFVHMVEEMEKIAKLALVEASNEVEVAESCLESACKRWEVINIDDEDDHSFSADGDHSKSAIVDNERSTQNGVIGEPINKSKAVELESLPAKSKRQTEVSACVIDEINTRPAVGVDKSRSSGQNKRSKSCTDPDIINCIKSIRVNGCGTVQANGRYEYFMRDVLCGAPKFRNQHGYELYRVGPWCWAISNELGFLLYKTWNPTKQREQSDPFDKEWTVGGCGKSPSPQQVVVC